jgi:hypothetical protein
MSTFQLPPKGSTIIAEILKGRICDRTGSRGRATIRVFEDRFMVEHLAERGRPRSKVRLFSSYNAAIVHFNGLVGRVKALHSEKRQPEKKPFQPPEISQ